MPDETGRLATEASNRIAEWGFCPDCDRWVCLSEHPDCGGDARASCATFACGRPIKDRLLVEIYGDGRMANLGYCELHV